MNALRRASVRTKLLLISMAASAAALLLAGLILSLYDLATARDHMRQELSVLAAVIGDRSTAALVFEDSELAAENLAAARARSSIVSACIYGADGRTFATFERQGGAGEPCPPAPPADGSRFAERALSMVQPIALDGERIGTIYLRSDLQELGVRLLSYGGIVVLVVLLAAGVAFVSSARLQKVVSEPIRHLAATARTISEGRDYAVRAAKTSDDELGVLVEAFNGMLDTIEDRDRALSAAKERLEALVEELEAQHAELERFTYTVSHDLMSPLITIKGFIGLLEKDARKGDRQRVGEDVVRINNAADAMAQLLHELLELSRIGRLNNEPEDVSMSVLAREAVDLAAGRIAEGGVEVVIAEDLPTVRGDGPRLLEVLQNLVENGVKFMGGQEQPRIEIGSRQIDGETVYHVRDNGIGIDPRFHDKVFGLFERLETGTPGTGIGLAIVKRIVEVHGGRIWVESEGPGKGTTFRFTLPPAGGSESDERPAGEEPSAT